MKMQLQKEYLKAHKHRRTTPKYHFRSMCCCFLLFLAILLILFVSCGTIESPVGTLEETSYVNPLCPVNYLYFPETNRCYKAIPTPKTFQLAEAFCLSEGANLTSVNSEIEDIFILGLYHQTSLDHGDAIREKYWIGQKNRGDSWIWSDGSIVNFSDWNFGEKLQNKTDSSMSGKRGFVCKAPAFGFYGVLEVVPEAFQTNDYTCFSSTGSCYKIIPEPVSFQDAIKHCRTESAHLASVNSELESIILQGLFVKSRETGKRGKLNLWAEAPRNPGNPSLNTKKRNFSLLTYRNGWKVRVAGKNGFICEKRGELGGGATVHIQ